MNPLDAKLRLEQTLDDYFNQRISVLPISEIETILLDQPELQQQYIRSMRLHAMLDDHFDSLAEEFPATPTPLCLTESPDEKSFVRRLSDACGSHAFAIKVVSGIAATILLALLIGKGNPNPQHLGTSLPAGALVRHGYLVVDGRTDQGIRSHELFRQITRTTSLSRLELPTSSSADRSAVTLRRGTALVMRSEDRLADRGYVFELPAGHQMDLFVDSNARMLNSVSVMELDAVGNITGTKAYFSNLSQATQYSSVEPTENLSVSDLRMLGEYSVVNASTQSRFYLFIGAHIAEIKSHDQQWTQSDLMIKQRSDRLTVIGWDDRGRSYRPPEKLKGIESDRDYDDIRAVIRVRPLADAMSKSTERFATNFSASDFRAKSDRGELKTTQPVMVLVSSSTRKAVRLKITDQSTGETVLLAEGESLGEKDRQSTIEAFQILSGESKAPKHYRIQADYQNSSSGNLRAINDPTRPANSTWLPCSLDYHFGGDHTVFLQYCHPSSTDPNVRWPCISVHLRFLNH